MSFREGWRLGGLVADAIGQVVGVLGNLVNAPRMRSRSRSAALRDLKALHKEVTTLYADSSFARIDTDEWMAAIILEAAEESGHPSSLPILRPFVETTLSLMQAEGLAPPPEVDWDAHFTLKEEVDLGAYLRSQARLFSRGDELFDLWHDRLVGIFTGILGYLPANLTMIDEEIGFGGSVPLIDMLDDPHEVLDRLLVTLHADDVTSAELFAKARKQFAINTLVASGIDPEGRFGQHKERITPGRARQLAGEVLIETYLIGTPFASLFGYPYPFRIPPKVRFEHCHIVGGTGHGKTQLMQALIGDDLYAGDAHPGVLVMDSQGDLIRTLTRLDIFDPEHPDGLADKLVIVDAADIEYPVCLNLFDFHLDRADSLSPLERETILNGTTDLFAYMFGALLGAELTQRQGVMFTYLARLMMSIPGATIHTLRQLMEDGEPFRPYMTQLGGTAQAFFETQFFSSSFAATKKQILTRLWGVLANTTLERMFSHERNRIDLFQAMNEGKIVLVNTAKDLLKQDGCQILGRFFIALLGHAVLERSAIPEAKRRPFHVYIDEAQEYFDERVEDLFAQARKYRVGITVAHQTLAQLSPHLRAALASNTSVKFAGGVSDKDARELAADMHCFAAHITGTKKRNSTTEFACFVRNVTPQALTLTIPLGALNEKTSLNEALVEVLRGRNRERYAEQWVEKKRVQPVAVDEHASDKVSVTTPPPSPVSEPAIPPPVPSTHPEPAIPTPRTSPPQKKRTPATVLPKDAAPLGRGGPKHTYLQNLIKRLGQERGFHATIEEQIQEGKGQVDVSLALGETKVAVEISVTTPPAHELGNVQKCLDAGYDPVFLIAPDRKHLSKLKKHIDAALGDEQRLLFLLPEECLEHLDSIAAQDASSEQKVRGYTVKVRYQPAGREALAKREAIAKVIANAMRRLRQDENER